MEFITFGMEKNEHHAKLIEKLIGNRHVRADKEYFHNPTNITNILFNDEIERIDNEKSEVETNQIESINKAILDKVELEKEIELLKNEIKELQKLVYQLVNNK